MPRVLMTDAQAPLPRVFFSIAVSMMSHSGSIYDSCCTSSGRPTRN